MSDFLGATARSFGFASPTFRLDRQSQQRLMWVSILPMLVVAAVITEVGIFIAFHPGVPGPEENFWFRVYLVATGISNGILPAAMAFLFAFSLQRWSRAAGSWMLVIGLALALAALALSSAGIVFYGFLDFDEAEDLLAGVWTFVAAPLGFLAIGYFFIAFRSLARVPRLPYGRRPRWRPRGVLPLPLTLPSAFRSRSR